MAPAPVLLPGNSHGRRSLVCCSPWGREESDTTERLHFHFHFHALEKEMVTHSSILARRIPGMGEPGGLPSMGSHMFSSTLDTVSLFNFSHSSWRAVVSHHEFGLHDLSGPEHSLMHSTNICWGFTKPQALCLCYAQLLVKASTILWHTQFCVWDWHLPIIELHALSHSCATLWTIAHQTLLSEGSSRQENWNGLPFPPPGIVELQGL